MKPFLETYAQEAKLTSQTQLRIGLGKCVWSADGEGDLLTVKSEGMRKDVDTVVDIMDAPNIWQLKMFVCKRQLFLVLG